MDEQQFRQTLEETAAEQVPAVDLWPALAEQLAPGRRTRLWGMPRAALRLAGGLAGAGLVLAAVLLFASWMASLSRTGDQAVAEPAQATVAAWNGLQLLSSEVYPQGIAPGSALSVTLKWQTPVAPLADLYVFLHLFAEDGKLIAQSDTRLEGGELPVAQVVTTTQVLPVPAPLPAGTYTLRAGVYDQSSGQRLPILAKGEMHDDGIVDLRADTLGERVLEMLYGTPDGAPTYGEIAGISPQAHSLFRSCGLDDEHIRAAVTRFESTGNTRETVAQQVSDDRARSWRTIVDVQPWADGLYWVTCARLQGGTPAPPSPQELLANLRLLSATLPRLTYVPPEALKANVTWSNRLYADLEVGHYLHLLDQDGIAVVQSDRALAFDSGAVSQIRLTETLRLPGTLAPGRYQLILGLFERTSGRPLPFSTASGQEVWSGALPVATIWIEADAAAPEAADGCPVSEPVYAQPPDDPNADPFAQADWYINEAGTLWAGPLPPGGRWQSGSTKVFWIRPAGTILQVSGRRLDGEAPPLEVAIPCCYPTGFQVGGLDFPTAGCWEINARAGRHELHFITEVLPPASPDASP